MAYKKPPRSKKTEFKKGQSGNPKGRPKSIKAKVKELIGREIGSTIPEAEYLDMCSGLMELSVAELKEIANDQTQPAFLVILARSLYEDVQKNQMGNYERILDRVMGKPKMKSEITGANGEPLQQTTNIIIPDNGRD